jgi:hypothetical protein
VSITACLDPYSTVAASNDSGDAFYPQGPSMTSPFVDPSVASAAPQVACGAPGGPLDRAPFNLSPDGSSETIKGQFSIANLTAEVILGS